MFKTILNSSLLKIVLVLLAIVIMGNLFTSKFVNKNNVDNFETLSEEKKKMNEFEDKLNTIGTEISSLRNTINQINERLKTDFFETKPIKKSKKTSKLNKETNNIKEKKNSDKFDNEETDDEEIDSEDDEPKSTVEKFAQQYVKGVSNKFVGDYMILE
jgi:predicted  nucleic acid-binding Zn-ribbon protein